MADTFLIVADIAGMGIALVQSYLSGVQIFPAIEGAMTEAVCAAQSRKISPIV